MRSIQFGGKSGKFKFSRSCMIKMSAEYMASIITFTIDKFIWIDETGSDLKEILRVCITRGTSCLSALASQGKAYLCHSCYLYRGFTGSRTNHWISKWGDVVWLLLWVPGMLPFDGLNPKSITIRIDSPRSWNIRVVQQCWYHADTPATIQSRYEPNWASF